MGFDINQKHKKKNNWTSSDVMDEIIKNRHGKEGWEGIKDGLKSFLLILPLTFFLFLIYCRLEL